MLCSGTLNAECGCTSAPRTCLGGDSVPARCIIATAVLLISGAHSPVPQRRDQTNVQPERLTSFKKWFSHEFAVPVPVVHGTQNRGGMAIEKVSSRPVVPKNPVS